MAKTLARPGGHAWLLEKTPVEGQHPEIHRPTVSQNGAARSWKEGDALAPAFPFIRL